MSTDASDEFPGLSTVALRDLVKDAITLLGPETTAEACVKAFGSRSALLAQLKRSFTLGKRESRLFGLSEAIRRFGYPDTGSLMELERKVSELKRGIAVYGLFTAEIGIGQSARRSAQALATLGIPVSTHNIRLSQFENTVEFPCSPDFISEYDSTLIHLNPDTLLWLFKNSPLEAFLGRRRIGFWHWELPVFPPQWARALETTHEIWVPSNFTARAVRAAGGASVRVVPHAVETDQISTSFARAQLGLPADDFLLLTMFDLNSWPARKNPWGAYRAFMNAFPRQGASSPRLVVKCHGRANRTAGLEPLLRDLREAPNVIFLDEVLSCERTRLLQAACDCFVSLHRSEGFGLPLLECMAL
ncbi:MAG: glycosyltransferase, partial [Bradyrhizobium sp.]